MRISINAYPEATPTIDLDRATISRSTPVSHLQTTKRSSRTESLEPDNSLLPKLPGSLFLEARASDQECSSRRSSGSRAQAFAT